MSTIHVSDIEAAINHWRRLRPAGEDGSLCPEVTALAEAYAHMAWTRTSELAETALGDTARHAWLAWYDTTPDTPCIAICSTSQGDDICKGCGRSFKEVQCWPGMTPVQKRATWRRITLQGDAWRFNRYAERAP
ncbi:MAG: DUF3717 domain-containing protein [Burkholderiaceae bacterium]|jgi:hypothetical protein|nr:DUF3717 domain-containing protein [Burkholderiaceae bacterium]MDP3133071.1 DUF3717 domain-containing protein [Burkholderiaceae bacterium]MDP3422975.1 DUF3717 domain-containing protein [Burkholderiaceae bacterium]